ncbi:hypothetical protein PFISCL1PPCAC_25420, partial [Pristionchus fissidentatus]
SKSLRTTISCAITWACAVLIPILFFLCECEYEYNYDTYSCTSFCLNQNKLYYNRCEKSSPLITTIITVLVYLSYACTCFVMILYMIIFIFLENSRLRKTQRAMNDSSESEMKLLTQSIVIFALYAGSIFSVLALSCMEKDKFGAFELTYAENLLNLSIAAVYPICLVAMSGEMRR